MDARTPFEKFLWKYIGEPLYYCEECLKHVDVKSDDNAVKITRHCEHLEAKIIAPRKAIVSGKGFAGLSVIQKTKVKAQQSAACLTGRNV
jgi:hypothetical protein